MNQTGHYDSGYSTEMAYLQQNKHKCSIYQGKSTELGQRRTKGKEKAMLYAHVPSYSD